LSRSRRADENEDEDEESGPSRDRLGEALGEGLLFIIGVWLIIVSNWSPLLIGIGAVFAGAPVLQIPAIRIAINNKTGHQIFQVSGNIRDSNIIQQARDVHIHEAPTIIRESPTRPEPKQERQEREEWKVDEEFNLQPGDYRKYAFDLEDEDELMGLVEADSDVSCYVLGRASLRSFEDEENFNPYWDNEAVTRTLVSFVAPGARTYFFVVIRSDEEDEDASVSVKLSVKS